MEFMCAWNLNTACKAFSRNGRFFLTFQNASFSAKKIYGAYEDYRKLSRLIFKHCVFRLADLNLDLILNLATGDILPD